MNTFKEFFSNNPSGNKVRYYSSFIMVIFYAIFGILFLVTDIAIETIPKYRTSFGITLIVYAAIRLFLTIKKNNA